MPDFSTIQVHPVADKAHKSAALPAILLCVVASAMLAGCAGITGVSGIPADPLGAQYGDRCYIEDSQFVFADQMYDRMGSLQLVEQELCNVYEWRQCEINEALYRLRKVHDLP